MNLLESTCHLEQELPNLIIFNYVPPEYRFILIQHPMSFPVGLVHLIEVIIQVSSLAQLALDVQVSFLLPGFIESHAVTAVHL